MTRRRAKKSEAPSKSSSVADLPVAMLSPEEQAQVAGGAASRFIGETEKNLSRTFTDAPPASASLLFTEGDELLK